MDDARWKDAVIDAAIVNWSYKASHETNPRQALHDVIVMEVAVALDPLVSEAAAQLRDTYLARAEAAEARAAAAEAALAAGVAGATVPALLAGVSARTLQQRAVALWRGRNPCDPR